MAPFFTGFTRGVGGAGFGKRTSASGINFPTAYTTLINTYSTSNQIWVDSINGNDSNSGQGSSLAKKTLDNALSVFSVGKCIILQSGNYTVTNNGPGIYGESMFVWSHNGIIVCNPGYVTIGEASDLGARDNHIFGMQSSNAAIYGAIIERNNNGRTTNYFTSLWGYNAVATYGKVYNCVIREINANGTASHVYDNTYAGDGSIYNCLIDASNWLSSYTCGASNVTQNTALTSSNAFSLCGTSTNNVNSATYTTSSQGTSYYLSSHSNSSYGVYSGTYSWTI
jgi:hypothetical protein